MNHLWIVYVLELTVATLPGPPVVRGTLEGNKVYTSGVNKTSTGEYSVSGGGMLSILRRDIRGDKKLTAMDRQDIGGDRNALLRWQLIDKNYYYVLYCVGGVAEVHSPDITRARLSAFHLPMLEAVHAHGINAADRRKRYRDYSNSGSDYWPFFGDFGDPNQPAPGATSERTYYDIWARGRKYWELYVTEPHRGNRLTREDFHPENDNRERRSRAEFWEKVGVWTFDWTGPFYVAVNGEDRYFVTDIRTTLAKPGFRRDLGFQRDADDRSLVLGSRIFVAPRAAKAGTPLKEVWKGRRVEALIHDNDTKTFFAFTKDQYFEIADPIKPRAHTVSIRRSRVANDALEMAAKCGRVIRGLPEPKAK